MDGWLHRLFRIWGQWTPLVFFFTVAASHSTTAQTIVVDHIALTGHRKTADEIIYRELDIAVGDTISLLDLDEVLNRNKKRLLSTGLFNVVVVNLKDWDTEAGRLTVVFDLKENWYIYPSVIWEYADRSFNVWWKDHRFNFKRTNYGLRLDHLNLTGYKDRLKLKFQRGYTHKYEAVYEYPYFVGEWGLGGHLFYSQNKEIPYKTVGNKVQFYKHEDERILLQRFRTGLQLTRRADAFSFHNVRLEFHHNKVDEFVAQELNPDYFLDGKTAIRFVHLSYDYQYDRRVFPTYPEGGYILFGQLKAEGLELSDDYNNLSVSFGGEKYFKLSDNLIYGGGLRIKYNAYRRPLAYANNTGLGWGNEVRGYELYVMDGSDYGLLKTDFKWRLFERIFDISDFMLIDEFDLFPVVVWARLSMDMGYVNEPTYSTGNELSNAWLIGGGPGIDVLLYNNYKLSVEYNFNRLGEGGLFFNGAFYFWR